MGDVALVPRRVNTMAVAMICQRGASAIWAHTPPRDERVTMTWKLEQASCTIIITSQPLLAGRFGNYKADELMIAAIPVHQIGH